MKYLITGGTGQLGYDIFRELIKRYGTRVNVLLPNHEIMDITNRDETIGLIKSYKPDVIFHSAAYTAVDKAEEDCKTCYDINVTGTKNICDAASEVGAKLIYVSTDYVFDGNKNGPYKVTDIPRPINLYGQTKLLGENIVREYPKSFVARTSWVFGINGKNFVKTMLKLAETKDEISVVSDQMGSPTYTVDLARLLVDMSETEKYGVYHTNNEGYTTWYEFAKYIFEVNGKDIKVKPVKTSEYKTAAPRPLNSCLDRSALDEAGLERLPDWHDAVDRFSKEIEKQKNINKVLGRSEEDGRNRI